MSSKYFLLACLLLALIPQSVLSQEVDANALLAYNKWRFQFKRSYLNDDEQVYRQQVFFENLQKVANHKKNKDATYEIGLNQFSDMTEEEFSQKILNNKLSEEISNTHKQLDTFEGAKNLRGQAQSVDWRSKGKVSPIKNQGSCGSCWTFSTTGVLESFNAIKNGQLVQFAEQQLLDCVTQSAGYQAYGCSGGWPTQAFTYATRMGIVPATQYPYVGSQGSCKIRSKSNGFFPKAFQQVAKTEQALKAALNIAPVAVLVNASPMGSYRSGVFNGCGYTTEQHLNHAVIAVGYDAQGNWIVRNSWGTWWGESGYIRLAPGNTCGVLLNNQVVTA